ncbi:hypothetical protein K466DRAFT_648634 [Polyporus arcularius HHB13444]|uniref:Fe2OG dioxygenase domain-containing protein n=1 Tax=Polyporus arcularius HHB13444 TaxID=1314778 RepID=A0A5C3NTE7_9APHY|nr:hypothetical protein K466DRAFT_648634 [Polyporus arcularius HHB13444]
MSTSAPAKQNPKKNPLKSQLRRLLHSIADGPPYCQGTRSLPDIDFSLFYGKEGNTGRLNLSSATEAQLQHLADACQPATFGRAQQNVHDEAYRKAGKLDRTDFLLGFDAERTGLVDIVHEELLIPRSKKKEAISAELYKLNVYGPGSFFKAHVDTPRSEAQFGSLVIVFPTAHEGGALAIREHRDKGKGDKDTKEWTFDTSTLLAECTEPSIAYVAFFSDVEHEVLPVTSGYRVTVTYNLCWTDDQEPLLPAVTTLRTLLDDPTFLPDGAVLMHGLHYEYPLKAHEYAEDGRKALTDLTARLKACDAVVYKVAQELGLPARLGVLYETSSQWDDRPEPVVLCDRVIPFGSKSGMTIRCYGGEIMYTSGVHWITHAPEYTREKESYMAYGNEAAMMTTYWQIYLRLSVGPHGDRGGEPRLKSLGKKKKRSPGVVSVGEGQAHGETVLS